MSSTSMGPRQANRKPVLDFTATSRSSGVHDAFVEQIVDLTLDRPHDAVNDEARLHVTDKDRLLARGLYQPLGLRKGGIRRSAAAMDLHQGDDMCGIEVVDTYDPIGAGKTLGKGVDGETPRVAPDDHFWVGGHDGAQKLLLGLQQFLDGLDHIVHIRRQPGPYRW